MFNEDFNIWVILGIIAATNAWPFWVFYSTYTLRRDFSDLIGVINEDLLRRYGKTSSAMASDQHNPIGFFTIGIVVLIAAAGGAVPFVMALASWAVARELAQWGDYITPTINQMLAQERQQQRQQRAARRFSSQASFEAPPDDDDAFFSSKAQQQQRERERPRQERKPPPKQETPYGFDKRHPKDAKLWAVVDDPNASDGERQAAFSAILKRNAQRKRGEDPKPATDADVTFLIGSDRK